MKCPRCNVALTDGMYEGESVSHCSTCGGVLINRRSLSTLLRRLSSDIYDKIDINAVIPNVPDPGKVHECPACNGLMDHYGYMESNKVQIDCCDECGALWLDALELAAMTKMYIASNKHFKHLRKTEYEGSDLFSGYAYSMVVSGAFLLGFSIG